MKIINRAKNLDKVDLIGVFNLYKDYNGKEKGIGAHLKLS